MRKTATLGITTTGVLTVIVNPDRTQWYVSNNTSASIGWSPVSGSSCTLVITWGDGATETKTVQTPGSHVHKYAAAGTYTVTAKVTDNGTLATGTGSASHQVANDLTLGLTSDKTSGVIPLAVTFTISYANGYTPYTATLAYGDGVTDTLTAPGTKSHSYTAVGTYTATLTVTDALGTITSASVLTDVWGTIVDRWNALTPVQKALCVVTIIGGIGFVAWKYKKI